MRVTLPKGNPFGSLLGAKPKQPPMPTAPHKPPATKPPAPVGKAGGSVAPAVVKGAAGLAGVAVVTNALSNVDSSIGAFGARMLRCDKEKMDADKYKQCENAGKGLVYGVMGVVILAVVVS